MSDDGRWQRDVLFAIKVIAMLATLAAVIIGCTAFGL